MRRRAMYGVVLVLLGLSTGCAREQRRYPGLERAFQRGWTVQEETDREGRSVLRFVSPDGNSHILGGG